MGIKEDMSVLKTDMKWMKQGMSDIKKSLDDFSVNIKDSLECVDDKAENNKRDIIAAKSFAKGLSAITIIIAFISFCIAVYGLVGGG